MTNSQNQIEIPITADQNSVQKLRGELRYLIDSLQRDLNSGKLDIAGIKTVEKDLASLKTALITVDNTFNSMGTGFDGSKVVRNLRTIETALAGVSKNAKSLGADLHDGYAGMDMQLSKIKNELRDASKYTNEATSSMSKYRKEIGFVESAMTTLGKTALWSSANKVFDGIIQSASDAVVHIQKLDESLNQIRLVSNMTSKEVAGIAKEANVTAKALGQTTVQYTDAAMLYLQQGKSLVESQKLAEATLVATNITGEKSTKVVELMTSAMNGYNYSADKAMDVLDKFAAVGAATASDFNELATGFSKVASMAKTAGVEFDQLNAMIATVASATREAPETIGTSFKSIFARAQSLKQGKDEDGNAIDTAELGRYAQQIKDATGINFFDEATGQLREVGGLVEEIGGQWDSMSKNTKIIVAEALAGQRQASRLHALFNSWGEYETAKGVSENAEGTALEQNAIRMDSLAVASRRVQASMEGLFSSMLDSDSFKDTLNIISKLVDSFTNLSDAIGGLGGVLEKVAPALAAFGVMKAKNAFDQKINPLSDPDAITKRGSGNFGAFSKIIADQKQRKADKEETAAYFNQNLAADKQITADKVTKDQLKEYKRIRMQKELSEIEDDKILAHRLGVDEETAPLARQDLKVASEAREKQQSAQERAMRASKNVSVSNIIQRGETDIDGASVSGQALNKNYDIMQRASDYTGGGTGSAAVQTAMENDRISQILFELTAVKDKNKEGTLDEELILPFQNADGEYDVAPYVPNHGFGVSGESYSISPEDMPNPEDLVPHIKENSPEQLKLLKELKFERRMEAAPLAKLAGNPDKIEQYVRNNIDTTESFGATVDEQMARGMEIIDEKLNNWNVEMAKLEKVKGKIKEAGSDIKSAKAQQDKLTKKDAGLEEKLAKIMAQQNVSDDELLEGFKPGKFVGDNEQDIKALNSERMALQRILSDKKETMTDKQRSLAKEKLRILESELSNAKANSEKFNAELDNINQTIVLYDEQAQEEMAGIIQKLDSDIITDEERLELQKRAKELAPETLAKHERSKEFSKGFKENGVAVKVSADAAPEKAKTEFSVMPGENAYRQTMADMSANAQYLGRDKKSRDALGNAAITETAKFNAQKVDSDFIFGPNEEARAKNRTLQNRYNKYMDLLNAKVEEQGLSSIEELSNADIDATFNEFVNSKRIQPKTREKMVANREQAMKNATLDENGKPMFKTGDERIDRAVSSVSKNASDLSWEDAKAAEIANRQKRVDMTVSDTEDMNAKAYADYVENGGDIAEVMAQVSEETQITSGIVKDNLNAIVSLGGEAKEVAIGMGNPSIKGIGAKDVSNAKNAMSDTEDIDGKLNANREAMADTQKQLAEAKTTLAKYQKFLDVADTESLKQQKGINELESKIDKLSSSIENDEMTEAERSAARVRMEEVNQDIATMSGQDAAQVAAMSNEAKADYLKAERDALAENYNQTVQSQEALRSSIETLSETIANKQSDLDVAEQERENLEAELASRGQTDNIAASQTDMDVDRAETQLDATAEMRVAQEEADDYGQQADDAESSTRRLADRASRIFDAEKIAAYTMSAASIAAAGIQLKTTMDSVKEATTEAEKTKAKVGGILSAVMAVGPAFGPWGIALSAVAGLAAMFSDQIVDMGDDLVQVRKRNDEILAVYQEQSAALSSQLQSLDSLRGSFESLNGEIEAAGGMGAATDEQLQKYKDLSNQMAELDSTTVKYYDSSGNAVLKDNIDLDERVEKLKEAQRENEKILTDNRGSFIEEALLSGKQAQDEIAKMTQRVRELDVEISSADASTSEYFDKIDERTKLNTSIAAMQGQLKDSASMIQDTVILPMQRASKEFGELGDSLKGMAAQAFNSDDINAYLRGLETVILKADEMGVSAADQAKLQDLSIRNGALYAEQLAEKSEIMTEAMFKIQESSAYEELEEKISGANEATKKYIATIASMAETASGAISIMSRLAGSISENGVVTMRTNQIFDTLKASGKADYEQTKKDLENLKKEYQEVSVLANQKAPIRTQNPMGYVSNEEKLSVMEQQANINQAKLEEEEIGNKILEANERLVQIERERLELIRGRAGIETQIQNTRSSYYLDMARGDEGSYNQLAGQYEDQYAAGANSGFFQAAYQSTGGYYTEEDPTLRLAKDGVNADGEEAKANSSYSGDSVEPLAEGSEKKEYEIQMDTGFEEMLEDMADVFDETYELEQTFQDMFDNISDGAKTFGEHLTEELADALNKTPDEIEATMDKVQDILKDSSMRDAIAAGNEGLAEQLAEVAELGTEASVTAQQAALEGMSDYQNSLGEMYAALNADDAQYWQNVIANNENEVIISQGLMGIRMSDYQTYGDYKDAVNQWNKDNAVLLANEEVFGQAQSLSQKLANEADWAMSSEAVKSGAVSAAEIKSQAEAGMYKVSYYARLQAEAQAERESLDIKKQAMQGVANAAYASEELSGAMAGIVEKRLNELEVDIRYTDELIKIYEQKAKDAAADASAAMAGAIGVDVGTLEFGGSGVSGGGVGRPNLIVGGGTAPPRPNLNKPTNNSTAGDNNAGNGGGKDKDKKEPKEKEQADMEWEKDWYHDINILLKKNADAAKKLSDIEDRTYGEQRLKNMREQARLLQERYELNKQALEIAKQEAAHYKEKVLAGGAKLNEDGSLQDYNGFIKGKVDAANAIADADAKKAAQDSVKDLINDIKRYEEIVFGVIKGYEDDIEEARQEAQDKLLEALEYEFDLVIKVSQVIIDDNGFLNDFLEGVERADKVLNRLVESAFSQVDVLEGLGEEFERVLAMDLDPGPKIEKLEELKEELLEAFSTLKELDEAMSQAIIDAIDKNVEALDYAFEELAAITSSAESMIEMSKLFGHGEDYEAINQMLDVIAEANELQLSSMITAKEELIGMRDALEEGTEEWKAANDAVLEMDENIREMTIETIELYREQLTNAFNGIMKELEEAMSGGSTLAKLREELDKTREMQNRYADSIDQTIFKQKMLDRIQSDIAKTNDPKKQQILQDFYDKQVATLGQKGALLESELIRTEKLYDITMAQMALEDARNNKSIMKLVRDDQGNWSYQYMADMAAIEQAQDALSQKLADLMAFDKQQFEATQDFIIQKREEYLQNMRELNEMYMNGEFESEAEYQAAMDALTQEFNDLMIQLEVDYNDLKLNLNESTLSTLLGTYVDFGASSEEQWQAIYTALNGMSATELALLESLFGISLGNIGTMTDKQLDELKKDWESAYTQINSKTTEGLGKLEGSWETTKKAISDKITNPQTGINKYLQDYANKVNEIAKLTGYDDLKNSSNGLKDASQKLQEEITKEKKKHEELTKAMKDEFNAIKELVKPGGAYEQIRKAYKDMQAEIDKYIKKINEAINKQKELGNQKPTTNTPGNGNTSGSGSGGSGGTSNPPKPSGPQGNGKIDKGDKVRVKNKGAKAYLDSAGTQVRPWVDQAKAASVGWNDELYIVNIGNGKSALSKTNNIDGAIAWLDKGDLQGYDTGGYTGAFGASGGIDGKNGKMALLHEKEIVLNKEDTRNMLQTIEMVRDIYRSPAMNLADAGTNVNQNIEIHADFSGVRNSSEIEDAFNNLLNKAIQYTKK